MKKVILIITVNLALVAGQLVLATGRSADGVSVSQAFARLDQLREENAQLAEALYTKSSLQYVASQAATLGLAHGQVSWVNGQGSVAKAQ